MEAKEKAKELYNKYKSFAKMNSKIKQCALIAVEELIKSWDEDLYKDCGASEYWQQVKAEIEKM